MKKQITFLTLATFVLVTACHRSNKNTQIIDLTHTFDSTTLYWPKNACGFEHKKDFAGINSKGFYYSSYSFSTPEHGGTHVDAPIHFAEAHQSVDKIPTENLCGEAVCIDVSKNALLNRNYEISVQDVIDWEKVNGTIPQNTIIIFNTGYGKFYPNRLNYFGTELRGDSAIPQLHFPGISPKLAEWLITNKKAKSVGLDTPSMDYGQSTMFETHRILLGHNIPGFENVANTDKLPAKNFTIHALPMKIGGGSGAPLRIIASITAS
jgi:kynurenine formamidase